MLAEVPPATGGVPAPANLPVTEPAVRIVNWSPRATSVATAPARVALPRLIVPVTLSTSAVGVPGLLRLTNTTFVPLSVALAPVSVPTWAAGNVTPGLTAPPVPTPAGPTSE